MNTFEIPLESLKAIEELLTAEFVKGLEREGGDVMVKMLVTHVHLVPGRKLEELEGDFLVVDFEGRYLRVLHISELLHVGNNVLMFPMHDHIM